jgi:hypothetical protein
VPVVHRRPMVPDEDHAQSTGAKAINCNTCNCRYSYCNHCHCHCYRHRALIQYSPNTGTNAQRDTAPSTTGPLNQVHIREMERFVPYEGTVLALELLKGRGGERMRRHIRDLQNHVRPPAQLTRRKALQKLRFRLELQSNGRNRNHFSYRYMYRYDAVQYRTAHVQVRGKGCSGTAAAAQMQVCKQNAPDRRGSSVAVALASTASPRSASASCPAFGSCLQGIRFPSTNRSGMTLEKERERERVREISCILCKRLISLS